jgi:hypothetical protein
MTPDMEIYTLVQQAEIVTSHTEADERKKWILRTFLVALQPELSESYASFFNTLSDSLSRVLENSLRESVYNHRLRTTVGHFD